MFDHNWPLGYDISTKWVKKYIDDNFEGSGFGPYLIGKLPWFLTLDRIISACNRVYLVSNQVLITVGDRLGQYDGWYGIRKPGLSVSRMSQKIVFGESICCYLGHPLVMTGSDVFPFPSWKGWKLFLRWISVDVLTKKERVYVMRGIFILMMKISCLHIFTFATNPNIIT